MSEPVPGQIPPAQPQKKGCGGTVLMVLAVLFILLVGGCVALFVAGKKGLEKAGLNMEELSRNPELAGLKMARGMLAQNPEVEVSPVDETAKSFSIRNKQSGVAFTIFMEGKEVKVRDAAGNVYDAQKLDEVLKKAAEAVKNEVPAGATPAPAQ